MCLELKNAIFGNFPFSWICCLCSVFFFCIYYVFRFTIAKFVFGCNCLFSILKPTFRRVSGVSIYMPYSNAKYISSVSVSISRCVCAVQCTYWTWFDLMQEQPINEQNILFVDVCMHTCTLLYIYMFFAVKSVYIVCCVLRFFPTFFFVLFFPEITFSWGQNMWAVFGL